MEKETRRSQFVEAFRELEKRYGYTLQANIEYKFIPNANGEIPVKPVPILSVVAVNNWVAMPEDKSEDSSVV